MKPSRRAASGKAAAAPPAATPRTRPGPAAPAVPAARQKPVAPPASLPPPRTSYLEALAVYEQGMSALQQHDFARAADRLRSVITRFAEERDLVERSRLYLALCERQLQPRAAEPENTAQRLYAATLALNSSDYSRAIGYLERVVKDEPANDQANYMLAVAYSQQGQLEVAIPYLQRAIAANADNRTLARVDPDLASLREADGVLELLDRARRA